MNRIQLEREGYRPETSLWDDGFGIMRQDKAWERDVKVVSWSTIGLFILGMVFVFFN